MWKTIILCAIVNLIIAENFRNYKVFRITPTTKAQVELLHQLSEIHDFTFWKEPFVNMQADLMVASHKLSIFNRIMDESKISYKVFIEDFQTLIDQTIPVNQSTSFNFTSYHTLDEIYKNFDDLAEQYPDKVEVVVAGETYEKRQIKGVKVSFKPDNPGVFIEGGIHANEWISPATTIYVLHQLLTSNDPDIRELAERHNWYIFPVFNPDGYVYTHTTDRLWRKTREPHFPMCTGTDLNRNWGYKWNSGGASNFSCSEIYAGSGPFSTIEAMTMSNYINSISNKFYAYIVFHCYAQVLMFPYAYTTKKIKNYDEMYDIVSKASASLKKRYGTEYQVGSIAEKAYISSGCTSDYMTDVLNKIDFVYELRDQGTYGYLLPPEQIIPTGQETMDSLITLFKEVKAHGYPKNRIEA
ncbi:hypothetical protein P5V15_006441 [Pogonomyrmex californicus]